MPHDKTSASQAGKPRPDEQRPQPQGTASGKKKPSGSAPRQKPPAKKIDPSAATIDRPAHPLPAVRTSHIDYDRYLERETARFKIFSAEERRARNRRIAIGLVIGVVVALILAWAVASRVLG